MKSRGEYVRPCGHQPAATVTRTNTSQDRRDHGLLCLQLMLGKSENQIWSSEYHKPLWRAWIDGFSSIPIVTLAILLIWYTRQYLLLVLFSSMLLHIFGDLPLHHDDAHRHFSPLLDWRFVSPVSCWDPAHHGHWTSLLEFIAVFAAAAIMYRWRPLLRPWVSTIFALCLFYWSYVFLVWM